MPYDSKSVMWQCFPMSEEEAKNLSAKGTKALKKNPAGEHSGTILFPKS
jgi:hypothetical protein